MEITVTANKRAENMQDVPIAIEAVTSRQLAASGITQTSDSDGVRLGQ
jgi:iron complex outermembrane receptor protein